MAKRKLVKDEQAAEVAASIAGMPDRKDVINEGDFERGVLSTGATLVDLAISSERVHGGGVPAGVIVEIYGPSSSGKTAVLAELAAGAKAKGGAVRFDDPEGRLDTKYAQLCGLTLEGNEYNRPDTVEDFFEGLAAWAPKVAPASLAHGEQAPICVSCEDSIAAFSTRAEMADPEMQYAAAKRAQKYHQGFRTMGRRIASNGWVIACSNHEMVNFDSGARTTPGGNALKYWASIRMRISKTYQKGDIKRTWKISSKTVERIVGIRADIRIVKNSCGQPFRDAPVFIIFGQGIDDIRGNLQWLKETLGGEKYDCIDKKYSEILPAIRHIEQQNYEPQLREKVIKVWNSIDMHFKEVRKPKVRF